MEDLTAAIDQGYEVDVIYLDFCKAFDKVPHKRLLAKIERYGVKGNVLGLIKEFLSERRQRVLVNGAHSEWIDITSGTPKGSALGPILFLIFKSVINDLPKVIKCLIKLFADDAKLYQIIKSNQDSLDLHVDVGRSKERAIIWKMLFDTKKCQHLLIGPSNPCDYFMPSDLGAVPIENVEEEKDLGVIIDRKLSFRQHIAKKVPIANRNLGIIYRTFTYLNPEIFLSLFKNIVRLHLEYASVIWSPLYKKDKITLENIQHRATRLIPAIKGKNYSERLKRLRLPTLKYRRERADMVEVY